MTDKPVVGSSKESNTNKDWLYWYENPSESASKIEQQEAEIERLRNLLCEICATHTDCRACKGILASKGVSNAHETNPRHTLDCDMVKHPNCTRCNCGSSIDPHYLEHVRQSPQGSVPTIGAPTALAAPGERLSSGDAIACISMALQNPPDTQEWSRLLSDCRHVIERLEDELVAAKSSRNDEQRLRRAAEKALAQPPGCGYPACGCADITQCEALKANAAPARCEWGCHVHWSGWPKSHHPNCTAQNGGASHDGT